MLCKEAPWLVEGNFRTVLEDKRIKKLGHLRVDTEEIEWMSKNKFLVNKEG